MEKTKTRSRYRRDPSAYPNFRPDETDRQILELVYQHRFLDAKLLFALMQPSEAKGVIYRTGKDGKRRPGRYGFGRKALDRRLQPLFHTDYLKRHYYTDRPLGPGFGSPPAIYGLGPTAPPVVSEVVGVPINDVREMVEGNKVKSLFLRHAIETATFRVLLKLACERSEGRVRLLFWEQGQRLQDDVTIENDSGDRERYSVYPDAFFGLQVEGKGNAHYFVEIDRGTMPIVATGRRSDLRKKILGYHHYRLQKKHSRRYFYRKLPDGQVVGLEINDGTTNSRQLQLGGSEAMRGFRVLFLAPGSVNGDGTAGGRIQNILSYFPTFKGVHKGTSLFWFAPLDAFSLEQPDSVFAPTWISPNVYKGLASLIE